MFCFVTVHMYILHPGFNTNSQMRAHFYFVYLPPLCHSQFWGVILSIYFKYNVCASTGGSFLPLKRGDGICLWLFHMFWLERFSPILNLRFFWLRLENNFYFFLKGPIQHMIWCMNSSCWPECIEDFISFRKLIIYRVMGISHLVCSEELLESPDNLWV